MKKILSSLCLALLVLTTQAQSIEQLPIDPKLRLGKLENGLTYYIRHNEYPKDRADFYIAHRVGATLEEDNQNGLAHFLEHMAFNGSTNFPGNRAVDYAETIGLSFGRNLNAYTGSDETVYMIGNIPVHTPGAIDSCLLILHDWSGSLSLTEEEIDKERGVIREEMRGYGGANWRMRNKLFNQIMPGNIYAKRDVIGTEEVIMNFKPETLRAFYKKWYRPDLQAIIIVGDINVDDIESKIKTLFADIPTPVNPAKREYATIEDNKEPLVGIVSDKEATGTMLYTFFKYDALPFELRNTTISAFYNYSRNIAALIMRERFSEIMQQANPPMVSGGLSSSPFFGSLTKDALMGFSSIKNNDVETGMKTLSREIERVNRYGFTESEYARAKANLITQYESAYKEREKTTNSAYVTEYVDHFIRRSYIPGIEVEYNIAKKLAEEVPLEFINKQIQDFIGEENIVIALMAAEKEGEELPTKEDLLNWFNQAKNEDIQPIEDTDNNEPLLSELPKGGSIKETSTEPIFGTTNYTLSNGVKVVIKPTTWKDDQILMTAFSKGGNSLFPETEISNIKLYGYLSNVGGLGNFSSTQLSKVLAGKKAGVSTYIEPQFEGLNGSSSVKDFETMLQLIYLNFTAPRKDEDACKSLLGRLKSQLEQQEANPEIAINDTITHMVHNNKLRSARLRTNDVDNANYDLIMKWRTERYADASDFTFVFTGNIDPETSKELIAQYLGALPALYRNEQPEEIVVGNTPGINTNHFEQKMENVKAAAFDLYWCTLDNNIKNKLTVSLFTQVMNIVFTEKIREDEGGTYGVNASASIRELPAGNTLFQIYFETQPDKVEYLNKKVHSEFKNVVDNGPRAEDLNKVKEYTLKKHKENLEQNGYWSSTITAYYKLGHNGYSDFVKVVNEITSDDIRKIAEQLYNSGNLTEIIMTGVN
ncbi:zinc protease [Dysgonomonadaceae bacterium PH5-43]|nr:zinc protease [Dysgonomonadaceae bacterium PH5-43]